MADLTNQKLSTPELQVALRLAALPPSSTSPFANFEPPASLDAPVLSSLRAKSVLNGDRAVTGPWREALATLASPTHRLSLFIGSLDRWQSITYYADRARMVGYSAAQDQHNVTFPVTVETAMQAIAGWLRWKGVPEAPPVRVDLSAEELTALAAVADAYREESLRAFLERRQPNPSRFSREQLLYELQAGSRPDARWLASLLNRHAPPSFAPSPERLDMGARGLAARGWLKFEGNFVLLETALSTVCAGMANLNPHVALSAGPAGAPGSVVLAMCAQRSYWVIEFLSSSSGQSWARLQELGGAALETLIQAQMAGLPKAPAPAASWTAPLEPAAAANAPVSTPSWTAPVEPARPVAPPGPVSRSMPPPRQPDPPPVAPKGAPARAASPPPAPRPGSQDRKCGRCGSTVPAPKTFCTRCGTPLVM